PDSADTLHPVVSKNGARPPPRGGAPGVQGECQGAFRAESPDDPPFLLLAPLLRQERCKPDGYSDPPAVCRDWMGMPATAAPSRCMKPTRHCARAVDGGRVHARRPRRSVTGVTGSPTVSRRMQSSGDRRTLGSAPEPETAMQTVVNSREFLAEERTLLAWLRTSLGIAALGFVLDRF